MTSLLAATVVVSAVWSSGAIAMVVLGILFFLLGTAVRVSWNFSEYLFLVVVVLSAPLAAYLAGVFLDRMCCLGSRHQLFSRVVFVASWALLLQSGMVLDLIEAACLIAAAGSWISEVAWLISCLGSIFFCGALIAFCISAIVWLVEIPLLWFGAATGLSAKLDFAACRPVLIVMSASLGFNLVMGLCVSQLWPTVILARFI